jgi:adenylate kinase family enzyme
LIQPYIDYQKNNNNSSSSRNNTSKIDANNNNNVAGPLIMSDEILCQLLIRKIEEDFPYITQEQMNNNNIEMQKKIYDLENQIEVIKKRKEEAKKPNPKDDQNIEAIENEIKSLKENSISGFILTDYPSNINQCYLLENYLTGFIEDKRKPKLEENKIIENISSIIDFKMQPKEKKIDKKSGLDFIVHLSTKESIINERFKSIKYDPIDDIIYTKSNSINDKNIIERLIDEIPYLSKEQFKYYKDEYNNNINKIISLYNQFGFVINSEKDEFTIENPNTNNVDTKEIIKAYQFIESEEINQITKSDDKNKKN